MKNVAAVLEDKISNGGDDAFAVRAGDEEDGGVFHFVAPPSRRLSGGRPACHRGQDALATPARHRRYFFRSFNISRAAFAPEPPVKPAPGCVPLPHKYKFRIG